MFVLLFAYVFGGAIPTPGHSYIDFLIPGILVQTMSFGGFVTAMGIAEDLRKGLIDRFRSLPMSRSAVLAGRTLSDIATNAISITVMLIVGVIIGFGFSSPFLHVVLGILILLLFGYAFSWVFAFIGLTSSSPEAAQSLGFILIFPLTFVCSAFVPPATMPGALQWFAEWNPFSITVNAIRALFIGDPAGNTVWGASPGPSASPPSSPSSPWRNTNAPSSAEFRHENFHCGTVRAPHARFFPRVEGGARRKGTSPS